MKQKSGEDRTAELEAPQIPTTISHFVFAPWNYASTPNSTAFSALHSSLSAGRLQPSGSQNISSFATWAASLILGLTSFDSFSSRRRSKRRLGTSLVNLRSTRPDLQTATKPPGFRPAITQIHKRAYETGRLLLQNRTLGKRMREKMGREGRKRRGVYKEEMEGVKDSWLERVR